MMPLPALTALIHRLGALLAYAVLASMMVGIFRGVRRAPGLSSGSAASWLRSPAFYLLAFTLFFAASLWGWRALPWQPSPLFLLAALLLGSLLYFPAMVLVLWARLALGSMYFVSTSRGAQLFGDHRLVTGGPFTWVRHPMYLGLMVAALGGLLIYQTWTTLAFAFFSPFLLLRIRREEAALARAFGEQWHRYCHRVPAVLPHWGRHT